jgi:hypothetical protein
VRSRHRPACYRPTSTEVLQLFTARDRPRADVIALPVRDPDAPGSLTSASHKALDAAGVLGTWQAEAALVVARLVDQGRHGASGIAANIRAHRQCMEFALQSGTDGAQVLDLIDRIFLDGGRYIQ